jgi:phosphoenolpyruvate synthase/pyruvate phosphate dikinase
MIITGKVKIIKKPEDYGRIKSSVIIVAKNTTPDIVLVVDRVAGIIVEIDNKLCHAAIIAREYGIPLAMGVEKATRKFKNGQKLRLKTSNNKILL